VGVAGHNAGVAATGVAA